MHAPGADLADIATDVLARVRDRAPRVHCITNTVAQNYTANVLLAAGAVPSMTLSPEEIASFVAAADALAAAIVDALHGLDRATMRARIKVT